jgi:hypothetical protein
MDDNDYCPYCTNILDEDQRLMELPCFHRAHTNCFLNLMNNPTRSLPAAFHLCELCQIPLFFEDENPNEEIEEEEEEEADDDNEEVPEEVVQGPELPDHPLPNGVGYYERIRNRVQSDENIKKDLKLYFKSKYNAARKQTAFKKHVKEKKGEINNSVNNLKEQLRTLIGAQRRSILQGQLYKDYKGAVFRKNIAAARFRQKYNLDLSDIRKSMYGQPGFKRWLRESPWRSSPSYILRRCFYRSYIRL